MTLSISASFPLAPTRPRRIRALGAGLLAALLLACSGGSKSTPPTPPDPSTPTVTAISLDPSAPALNIGASVDLTANATYSDGTSKPVDNSSVWASSQPSVASVSAMGVVSALAAGSTTISATKDGRTGSAVVTVTSSTATLSALVLDRINLTLTQGGTSVDLTVTAQWSNGTSTVPYDSNVSWSSSNPAVATVNAAGVVAPLAGGATVITASASGRSATCNVTVQPAPASTLVSLTVNPTSRTLNQGQQAEIVATANWSNGTSTVPFNSSCTWASSNPAVASVNASGWVTAVSAGNATITATAGGRSATCAITVNPPAQTVDPRLVGRWEWIGMTNPSTSVGSFYTFNADGTFTYSLIMQVTSGCISHRQVTAYHQGTFRVEGSLDNPASAGKIVMTCATHFNDWTNCQGGTTRTNPVDPNGNTVPNPHFHWAAFLSSTVLATNHADDFMATGTLNHVKK